MLIRALIQARMSSRRFPGKALAPLAGTPIIEQLLQRVARVFPPQRICLLTSDRHADDPLALFVSSLGYEVFRGSSDDVFDRYRTYLEKHPCDYFFRLTGDSPLLDDRILVRMISLAERKRPDMITNLLPRTWPRGQSAELLAFEPFMAIDEGRLTKADREQVTRWYYGHTSSFSIENVALPQGEYRRDDMAVETVADLDRLTGMIGGGWRRR